MRFDNCFSMSSEGNRVSGFTTEVEPHRLQEFQMFDESFFAGQDLEVEIRVQNVGDELNDLDPEVLLAAWKFFNVPQEIRLTVYLLGPDGFWIFEQRTDEDDDEESSNGAPNEDDMAALTSKSFR
ncbi:hypothetical protein ElyMa_000003700 [Elysia marginata]|uniref:Uncharacterized protein n=1 Tax=Elysia marginata TaxID=1093978 RepID=A0AAV4EA09_9GAST|nr:hypothetical protein ElyMa_000003700 [Elysia marginata]